MRSKLHSLIVGVYGTPLLSVFKEEIVMEKDKGVVQEGNCH